MSAGLLDPADAHSHALFRRERQSFLRVGGHYLASEVIKLHTKAASASRGEKRTAIDPMATFRFDATNGRKARESGLRLKASIAPGAIVP